MSERGASPPVADPRDRAGEPWRAPGRLGTPRDPRVWLAVAVGGACGGALRTALEDAHPEGSGWPWVTFLVNMAGVALLALVAVRLTERVAPTTYPRPFLGTGLCGGLTTFSTLQVEVVRLAKDGSWDTAAGYLAATLAGGALVVFVVARLARRARWRA